MQSDHATRNMGRRERTKLSDSDAAWLRRGQGLGEFLLTSRKYAGFGWAAALTLAGGSLIALALLGAPETGMDATINTVSTAAP